jgi:deoxyribose-phosphate aldolase
MTPTSHPVSDRIEHTLLKADAPVSAILSLCEEAKKHSFRGVCVYPTWINTAKDALKGSSVKVVTVIGFPHGCSTSSSKASEAIDAISRGADEIDMVVNLGLVKSKDWDAVEADIRKVKEGCGSTPLKVILETSLLTDDEKKEVCHRSARAGADFVKTSTGFAGGGATVGDILLMKKAINPAMKIKASGGIRSREDALELIRAGADTLGTSSGVTIVSDNPPLAASRPSEKY